MNGVTLTAIKTILIFFLTVAATLAVTVTSIVL